MSTKGTFGDRAYYWMIDDGMALSVFLFSSGLIIIAATAPEFTVASVVGELFAITGIITAGLTAVFRRDEQKKEVNKEVRE